MSRWSAWGDDTLPDYDESDRYDRAGRTCHPTHGDPCGECAACGGEEPADDDSADDSADGDSDGDDGDGSDDDGCAPEGDSGDGGAP